MSLHGKISPAGITLHANDSLPIRESDCHLVHLECCNNDCNDDMRSCLHSSVMLAVIVRQKVGPLIFDDLTGAYIL